MKTWEYEIQDLEGLHVRPACQIASAVMQRHSNVLVHQASKTADGKNVLELLGLGARRGDRIIVEVSGEDEEETLEALKHVFC